MRKPVLLMFSEYLHLLDHDILVRRRDAASWSSFLLVWLIAQSYFIFHSEFLPKSPEHAPKGLGWKPAGWQRRESGGCAHPWLPTHTPTHTDRLDVEPAKCGFTFAHTVLRSAERSETSIFVIISIGVGG